MSDTVERIFALRHRVMMESTRYNPDDYVITIGLACTGDLLMDPRLAEYTGNEIIDSLRLGTARMFGIRTRTSRSVGDRTVKIAKEIYG